MAFLEIENYTKKFGETEVLKGISFTLEKGQVLAIIGSSGGGKTILSELFGDSRHGSFAAERRNVVRCGRSERSFGFADQRKEIAFRIGIPAVQLVSAVYGV